MMNELRLLLVTPYSPRVRHGHASDDIGPRFYEALARLCDLTVYAPAPVRVTGKEREITGEYRLIEGPPPVSTPGRLLGRYPAAARKDWSRAHSREVLSLARELEVDAVHIEYLQPSEVGLRLEAVPWSITLHDIGTVVTKQAYASAHGPMKVHRWLESKRVSRLESRVLSRARITFALSEADARWAQDHGAVSEVLPLGIELTSSRWEPDLIDGRETLLFSGAMWRQANESAAVWLVQRVLPLVRAAHPQVSLKIVGDRPTRRLLALADETTGVEVAGHVDDLDIEYRRASLVLAPTLVDAGVLLKVQRGLACGAPMVLNSAAAAPFGLVDEVHALIADDPVAFASDIRRALRSPDLCVRLGARARAYAGVHANWDDTAKTLITALQRGRTC